MALTRKMLKAMGIDEDKIDTIIEAHAETVDALRARAEGSGAKGPGEEHDPGETGRKAGSSEAGTKNSAAPDRSSRSESGESELENLKSEFEKYKREVELREARSSKESLLRTILKSEGIGDKWLDRAVKLSDLDKIELEGGKLKNENAVREMIKTEYADLIEKPGRTGADTKTPPDGAAHRSYSRNDIRKMTPAEINKNYEAIMKSLQTNEND